SRRYGIHDRASIDAVLDVAEAIAEEKYLPCAASLDAGEPRLVNGRVDIIPEVGEALAAYRDAGFFAASFDEAVGGLQLPWLANLAVNGIFTCANISVANYHFLTIAAANLLNEAGSDEQKRLFLPPMLEGRWFGTMCLSEPQAGSSLSDIRTRAEPTGDGFYRIVGNKMWISGGDHDLSDNIVHMVLAKIPGGPPGVRGISLFVVPKHRVLPDGSLGARNDVVAASLNHKMGQRGTTNAALNFGERGACIGQLVGEANMGLKYMFRMMNEARTGVGHAAVMLGLAGYLYSLDYARSRLQGRLPGGKDPESPQVPIIHHSDVKRMLMAQKAAIEGALALSFYCGLLLDLQKIAETPAEEQRLALLLDLLTPIAKSWPSEYCLEANKLAIQILGGYGYTRDYPVERFYRDNRLNHIHEGALGIQGLDLLGRKVRLENGAAMRTLFAEIALTTDAASGLFDTEAGALGRACAALGTATDAALACEDIDLGLANATLYLDAFGHVVIAWMWLRQAIAAQRGLASEGGESVGERAFYEGKIAACRYFFRYELPRTVSQLALVRSLDDTCLRIEPAQFIGI
ncbi:MAG: acyl-CoA dehydrogenase domain protein, partial [Sphingomonas bacterium]|uniref:acyl-CoA dehydrogenase n=1 Tax=Sphingomonas bacterium TaxID=1895847 RepID=UPI0026210CBD